MRVKLLVGMLVYFLIACSEERLVDVSHEPEFKEIIGSRYRLQGGVDAYGIRDHSKSAVKYVTLISSPGIVGSEVAFRLPVNIGSEITILKVLRSNRIFDKDVAFVVRLVGMELPSHVEVRVDLFRGNEKAGTTELNDKIYGELLKK